MKEGILATIGALALLVGCNAGVARSPVRGTLFTGVQASDNVTENPVSPKIGKICATSFLGAFAFGSAAAAGAAGTNPKISIVDDDMTSILGIWAQHCTIVHDSAEGGGAAAAAPAAGATPATTPAGGTPIGTAPVNSPPPPAPPPGTPAK